MNDTMDKAPGRRARGRVAAAFCAGLLCLCCAFALSACSGDALKTTEDAGSAASSAAASASPSPSGESAQAAAAADASKGSADGADDAGAGGSSEAAAVAEDAAGAQAGAGADTEAGSATEGSSASDGGGESEAVAGISVSVVVDASAAGYGTFASVTVRLDEGATVYDALCATGLPFGGGSGYVSSINGLSEFDFGATSGWTYTVNGTEPSVSCGSYTLSAGDSVVWRYVTSM